MPCWQVKEVELSLRQVKKASSCKRIVYGEWRLPKDVLSHLHYGYILVVQIYSICTISALLKLLGREDRIYQWHTFWSLVTERLPISTAEFGFCQHHLGLVIDTDLDGPLDLAFSYSTTSMFSEDITVREALRRAATSMSCVHVKYVTSRKVRIHHPPRHQKLPASVSSSAMAMSTEGRQAEEEEKKKKASGLNMRWWWWHGMAMHLKPSRWCNPTTVVVRGDWEEIGGGDDACGVGCTEIVNEAEATIASAHSAVL